MPWRYLSRLPVVASFVALGCRPPAAAHSIDVANPGATFDVELSGCSTIGATGRRFGPDVRTAFLWSNERVHTATYLPCTATMHAVRGGQRTAVYRVSRTRDGAYREELLHPQP
jgi:hypothetical protein